ncbi:MAG: SAM-dependent methyltransferase [Candidatus Latescibacteria bacterium]|nr:SAM-dependent methyltransferase [Candidatus Latescibacterota bacterium]
MAKRQKSERFVSRGGDKLDGALIDFNLDVANFVVADLGANVGGFTDCLLQCGVLRIYAVDTGYGVLDWKLRQDDCVVVMERTNALHVSLPELVDLVVIDVAWTPLNRIVPRALSLLKEEGVMIALLKPQYEARDDERIKGVVKDTCVEEVVSRTISGLSKLGVKLRAQVPSHILGSGGNRELFLLLDQR